MRVHKTVKHPGRDISQLVDGQSRSGVGEIYETLDENVNTHGVRIQM